MIDLDDTLIYTHIHYTRAQNEFARFISSNFLNFNYSVKGIIDMQINKQSELIRNFGFDTEVFPESFRELYSEIAREFGMSSDRIAKDSDYVYEIGKSVFEEDRWKNSGMYLGAVDTLEFLTDMGDELILVTLGDSKMQNRKVEVMGLEKYFSGNIHVVLREKGPKIAELSSRRDKDSTYFVGNSYNSDICPALDAGIRGIYIPQDTWSHDGTPNDDHHRMIQLGSIFEIRDIYNSL